MGENQQTIDSKTRLVESLEAGTKPAADWMIGTEHEKFVFNHSDLSPANYQGETGIGALMDGLRRFGWNPIFEDQNLVALELGGASVTLEPGGQFELSGAKLKDIHQTCKEVNEHLRQVKEVGEELDLGFIGLGFHPTVRRDEVPLMPKSRYEIMRNYMPKRGQLGLDMMLRTATVQVNLDFESEADMVRKFRVGLALQPLATALFANSPFVEGNPNGFKSYRSHVWADTDPDRTGMLPFVFDEGFGFERYVDYILDVPMYFLYRDSYLDASGQSFRDFMAGRLPALPNELPRPSDWEDHLTTVFPEVRLKTFLEMRGADGGPWSRLCALPAFWVGLLYDGTALDAVWDLVKSWTVEEMHDLRNAVPKQALNAPFRGGTLRDLAAEVVAISDAGLAARNRLGPSGETEQGYLQAIHHTVESNIVPADELLLAYGERWHGDISRVFEEFSY
jgi:glutamate--cysteine ligase